MNDISTYLRNDISTDRRQIGLFILLKMPTLANIGRLSFHPDAEVPDELKMMQRTVPAIDIIVHILKNKIDKAGLNNKFLIVKGRTGSGKSTFMISYLFDKLIENQTSQYHGCICVCEPRVVLTRSNSIDIMRYNKKFAYGENMGVLTSIDKIYPRKKENITFCTTQTLNNVLINFMSETNERVLMKKLSKYKIIVIDEVHVLNIQTISILKTIKNFLGKFSKYTEMPIIIFASATLNENKLLSYFHDQDPTDPTLFVEVGGYSNFTVVERYLTNAELLKINKVEQSDNKFSTPWNLITDFFYHRVFHQLFKSKSKLEVNGKMYQIRDSLLFIPSTVAMDIIASRLIRYISKDKIHVLYVKRNCTLTELNEFREKYKNKTRVLIVGYARGYSEASDYLVETTVSNISEECLKNETKIFLSTAAIEAGKTISTLYFCLDLGIDQKTIFNPLRYYTNAIGGKKVKIIKQIPENINQKKQRMGRVGREAPGIFLNFFSKDIEHKMLKEDIPETINNYILSPVLMATIMNKSVFHVLDFMNINDFYEKISLDILLISGHDLILSGIINSFGEYNPKLNNEIFNTEPWLKYAEILYYLYNYKLLDALVFASINRYEVSDCYYLFKRDPSTIGITVRPQSNGNKFDDVSGKISDARNAYTKIIYNL